MEATTRPDEKLVLQAARLWDPTTTHVAHVRSGENSVWTAALHGRDSILRLTTGEHRSREQIEAELDFVEHLAACGLTVARPVAVTSGERVVEAPQLSSLGQPVWAVVFKRLHGRHFEFFSPDIDRPLFFLWGQTMGELHEGSSRFAAREECQRPQWQDDSVAGCDVGGLSIDRDLLVLREELVGGLQRYQPEPDHFGLVHGDFERTNFLMDNGTIGLFDFDDSCYHWFAWDIACALWVFRNGPPDDRSRFLGWFLEGYSTVREPDTERLDQFTELVRLRTVALVLHRLRHPGRFANEADREWIRQTLTWLRSDWRW